MRRFEDMKSAIEVLSKGKNVIIYDDIDAPSVMVVVEKDTPANVGASSSTDAHPAFILDGTTLDKVYMSKFINIVANSRAYSLPYEDPRAFITWTQSRDACKAKGSNWTLTPNALWAFIAHRARKNGTQPHGNTSNGKYHADTSESGELSALKINSTYYRTYTGSGPDTWNDTHDPFGIADMTGNVWEWTHGLRVLPGGEISVIPYANCVNDPATGDASGTGGTNEYTGTSGSMWKGISQTGDFLDTGNANALKFNYTSGTMTISTTGTSNSGNLNFKLIGKADGITIPNYLVDIGVFPTGNSDDYGQQNFWFNLNQESMCKLVRWCFCWSVCPLFEPCSLVL